MKKFIINIIIFICIIFCNTVTAETISDGYIVKVKNTEVSLMSIDDELSYIGENLYRADDIDLETIANEISHATSISYPDLLAAIKALEIHISKHVMNGSAVKFGMLGSFIPTIRSKAVRTVDEVDTSVVKRVTCRFYPSKSFRESLKSSNLEFKDLSKIKYN